MKIGILTYHRSQNYGALLQAYALQDYIQSLGHDVSFVDYWPKYHAEMYKLFSLRKLRSLKGKSALQYIFNFFFTLIRLPLRRLKTKQFIKKYLKISSDTKFDLVVYGSDQIWRKQHQPTFQWYNPVYFGDGFVDCPRKIAYAASMGHIEVDSDADSDFIRNSFDRFDAISIRERDFVDFISNKYGLEYPLVCDPVFLIGSARWNDMVKEKYIPKTKYILYYRLQNLPDSDMMVETLAKNAGLEVVELRGYVPRLHYGRRYRFTANAEEMVSLIKGAEYVVTSAFHGIAMSLIFNKQFYYCSQDKQANRVASLLGILGLQARMYGNPDFVMNADNVIDYDIVNTVLGDFVAKSRKWLTDNIQNA